MANRTINLDDLRAHLNHAKERIALEKQDILHMNPLPDDFGRDEYAFAYKRAERMGLRAIDRRLTEIAWLPMQLDPKAEILADGDHSMKRWLTSAFVSKPTAADFGNDFIHALARSGLRHGWDDSESTKLANRIGLLFRDLSCLVGLIYYCTWLAENRVDGIQLSNPDDLSRSAEEIAALIQSPELYSVLRAREQDVEKTQILARANAKTKTKKKMPPVLRVIENAGYVDPFMPDPVMG